MNTELNNLIMLAMKEHDTVRTETLRAIKTAFLNWKTAKENVGKELDTTAEIQILNKMVKQRQESIEQFVQAGRTELADVEKQQMTIIQEFLPKAATEEEILNTFHTIKDTQGIEPIKKNMGLFVKNIKSALPNADGKLVAQIVSSNLQ